MPHEGGRVGPGISEVKGQVTREARGASRLRRPPERSALPRPATCLPALLLLAELLAPGAALGHPPHPPLPAPPRSKPTPNLPTAPLKPTAPIHLELQVLEGGKAGERARLLLVADPLDPSGRLDLDLALPPGIEVVGGVSGDRAPASQGRRSLEIEVEVPLDGIHEVVGTARLRRGDGRVWGRSTSLLLPVGSVRKPEEALPRRALPGGGEIIEIPGVGF